MTMRSTKIHPTGNSTPTLNTPFAILVANNLSRAEKVVKLRQMAYEEREKMVAAEEGMSKEFADREFTLKEIYWAMRHLGVDDVATDSKH